MSKLDPLKKIIAIFLFCLAVVMASPAQEFDIVANFDGTNGNEPFDTLAQGADGNLYGTTLGGGTNQLGSVFRVARGGTLTTLHSFNFTDGTQPFAGLILATDGNFFGTTYYGGDTTCNTNGCGTIFEITPTGSLTTMHKFDQTDGEWPYGGLAQAVDGNFYGTTISGGANNGGTIFKITRGGVLTTLYTFCARTNCTDGAYPEDKLVQATDGNFYGTTYYGGDFTCDPDGCGTIFKITPAGVLTTLYDFRNDGDYPQMGLVQATDGNFYGTTGYGGSIGYGNVFRFTPQGALTELYSFCTERNCADGESPRAGLVQATDGNFYGTTVYGGAYGDGTVFQITPGGVLTTLHSFCAKTNCPDGELPAGGLVQATNGILYGTTESGGTYGNGTVFSLDMGLGPFVTFVQAAGKVGQTGPVLGQGFTGTASVSLNGLPASFTVKSDTLIEATVPTGATTGYVTVATPSGTLTSNVPFHVIK